MPNQFLLRSQASRS
jgi:SHAQKYF class myb-like DNA-binding protein